jgi:hypothetical protein
MRYLLAALALGIASPALATPVHPYTITWNPQSTALPAWTTATITETFTTPGGVNGTSYVPKTVAGVFQESVKLPQDTRVALFDVPLAGMTGQYIGIVNGGEYTIDLLAAAGARFFSFAFNNLDQNDKLTLYYANGTTQDILGFDILNGPSIIGGQNSHDVPDQPNDWGRVSYDMGSNSPITKATFSSGSGTWYIDSIAWAAPEPATWALMILGFGLAGWQIRRRRRAIAAPVAA